MDKAALIDIYLSDKRDLITDDDSFNADLINENTMEGWRFAKIPAPKYEDLLALAPTADAKFSQLQKNIEAMSFLSSTDWKVIRHMDQIAAGLPTSLTEQEHIDLLIERQKARNSIVR